ncbi:DNA-binding transcriptional LysR family regulator [Herbaspirillum sp. Sphag1AN]|uniref:LysR family transcriptional regulator n=1 Tax=unclassified Herbaspirillum TaxID=2624150 RepID=UPI0016121334|nr:MULTISPECIES: LysR family transcriptional regulator [unclassified Herbaspirillum]MBB3211815.1 DNA-binding transcriptional LysR family regulator [Herbaspirillum sp. Sphag1AN]MBB3244351.1 DNA-binding transcriptional LysR family regulator [Herbaspirillum sp. Sphag64]
MDFSSLEILCVVAEEGGITRAAQKLNRVQSNVTTRVQQLEEQLGVALFQREGKRMILTAEGERFIVYAKRLLSLAQEAMQSVNRAQPLGRLKIGSMEATAASRLPGPLAAFHSTWPDVMLEVSTGTSERLLNDVSQHRLDCALVALVPGQSLKTLYNKLSGVKIWNEQLMLLKPQNDSGGAPPNLAAFEQGCTYRAVGQEWFRKTAAKGVHVIEKNSYHGIMASVAAGTCAAVMPQSVLDLYQGTTFNCTVSPLQEVDTWLVWREQYKSAALDAFREICSK